MRPNQLWLDIQGHQLRIWMDSRLQLATAKGTSTQRVGFFREIPLFFLPTASAHPMGWSSFPWEDLQGKFNVEKDFWPALETARLRFLNDHSENFAPPLSIELPLASDVVFFGGSFDPWHEGHTACIDLAPSEMPLIVCPDRNPHKPIKKEDDIIQHFLGLKKKIVTSTKRSLHVHPGFLLKTDPNPTVGWVLKLKRHRPDLRVHLLMGYDSFKGLANWTQADDLIKLLNGVMVASRLEQDVMHENDSKWALTLNPHLQIRFLGHHPHEAVSSTALRG